MKPTVNVVWIQHQSHILSGSGLKSTSTNLTGDDAINYGGGGSGSARARQYNGIDWDE